MEPTTSLPSIATARTPASPGSKTTAANRPSSAPTTLPTALPGTRGSYHSLRLADFDGDGDDDILVVEQEDPYILPLGATPRWFLWENLSNGRDVRFEERVILDQRLGGHDVLVGDIDGDGDLDIASKIWSVWKDNSNGGAVHLDWLENLSKTRPKPEPQR